jgi:hypothetical protein
MKTIDEHFTRLKAFTDWMEHLIEGEKKLKERYPDEQDNVFVYEVILAKFYRCIDPEGKGNER